ncbi:DUF2934 domain-containing protein [Pseudomonas viridiflava]|uniref:DUF2934 domain-containing protein n=1 Tax=Pseudomonas viridiflava TaxID=33069 RepID=UPI001F0846D0|nr:DUF2934 domain-containing protein [Pseudomonas viridiflava]
MDQASSYLHPSENIFAAPLICFIPETPPDNLDQLIFISGRYAPLVFIEKENVMNEETLKQIAYRLWEEQGKPDGMDFEHWLEARRELDGQNSDGLTGSITSSVAPPAPKNKANPAKRKVGKTKSDTSSSTV